MQVGTLKNCSECRQIRCECPKRFGKSTITTEQNIEEREREELDEKARFTRNVSMLRQWLNEDRITESSKMVTNEELLHWFKDVE